MSNGEERRRILEAVLPVLVGLIVAYLVWVTNFLYKHDARIEFIEKTSAPFRERLVLHDKVEELIRETKELNATVISRGDELAKKIDELGQ